MGNPIKGSDLDIKVILTYKDTDNVTQYITDKPRVELLYYDSYNCGKVWKYEVPSDKIGYVPPTPTEEPYWNIRFDGDKQRYAGVYNVRCAVDFTDPTYGRQQILFKNAFKLEDMVGADSFSATEFVPLIGEIETSALVSGQLIWPMTIKDVEYVTIGSGTEEVKRVRLTFTNGSSILVPLDEFWSFKVLGDSVGNDLYDSADNILVVTN